MGGGERELNREEEREKAGRADSRRNANLHFSFYFIPRTSILAHAYNKNKNT